MAFNMAGEWDRLPVAPYLSYLHPGRETGLSADIKGWGYGRILLRPGSISIPFHHTGAIFPGPKRREVELVLNALTGKSQDAIPESQRRAQRFKRLFDV